MIRVLLDTDHVSLHERGHLPLRARLVSVPPEEVAVSVVTVEEMLRGRLAILARRSEGEAYEAAGNSAVLQHDPCHTL